MRAPVSTLPPLPTHPKPTPAIGVANEDTFPFFPHLNIANDTGFSHWNYGTRSETLHLTSSISPTWQLDISGTAKRSDFTEVGLHNVYQIIDDSNVVQAGAVYRSGAGRLPESR